MPSADLYLGKVNFLKYFNQTDCAQCGASSCEEFIEAIKKGLKDPKDCPFLNKKQVEALKIALSFERSWPEVPLLTHPRPSLVGLVELNGPKDDSVVLISGNNEYTEQVLLSVLGTTPAPFFVIFIDTDGNTIDMAMIYHTLNAERLYKTLKQTDIETKVRRRELIIPGFASSLKEDIEKATGWHVRVGPICAAELPLFLSEIWIP